MPPSPSTPTLVQRAGFPPGRCAVTGDIDGPFIDCGISYENRGYQQRLYLHAPWVAQIARQKLGMVEAAEKARLEDENRTLRDEIDALSTAIDALHGAKESVPA